MLRINAKSHKIYFNVIKVDFGVCGIADKTLQSLKKFSPDPKQKSPIPDCGVLYKPNQLRVFHWNERCQLALQPSSITLLFWWKEWGTVGDLLSIEWDATVTDGFVIADLWLDGTWNFTELAKLQPRLCWYVWSSKAVATQSKNHAMTTRLWGTVKT